MSGFNAYPKLKKAGDTGKRLGFLLLLLVEVACHVRVTRQRLSLPTEPVAIAALAA